MNKTECFAAAQCSCMLLCFIKTTTAFMYALTSRINPRFIRITKSDYFCGKNLTHRISYSHTIPLAWDRMVVLIADSYVSNIKSVSYKFCEI